MPISDYHVVGDASLARPVPSPYAEKTDIEGPKTVQGNPITLSDSAPVNAVNVSVDVEPIQDLHSYDHPWVGGAGKNKLPMTVDGIKALNTVGTWSGNVYTINNGTFTILTDSDNNIIGFEANGTFNADTVFQCDFTENHYNNCIVNGCNVNGSLTTYFISVAQNVSPWTAYRDIGQGASIGSFISGSKVYVLINIRSDYNAQNLIFKPMIRLATETDSTFVPYTNICSISGRTEENVVRVGKNLFGGIDFAEAFSNSVDYTLDTTNKVFTFRRSDVGDLIIYDQFKPNTRYTLFISAYANLGTNRNSSLRVEYTDGTIYYFDIKTTTKSLYTYTTTSGKSVKRLYLGSFFDSTVYAYYDECGLFEGVLTTSDFEPYQGKTYTIQLGQEVYGGRLDVTRGKLVVDRGFAVYDGSDDESLIYMSGALVIINVSPLEKSGTLPISNQYKPQVISNWTQLEDFSFSFHPSEGNMLRVKDSRNTSLADWKTYLASNPLQICYELATHIEIDLTPTQIKLLENTNTIYTDYNGDTIHIEYQPNNAIGEAVRAVEESYDAIIQNLIDRVTALENQ